MGAAYQQLNLSLAADDSQDIWSLLAPAGFRLKLLGWELTSEDLTAQLFDISLHYISAVGSGGSLTGTEELVDQDTGETIRGTVRTQDTTPGADNGGIKRFKWEQLGPLGLIYIPEMRPGLAASTGIALTANTAITAEVAGYICWGWATL